MRLRGSRHVLIGTRLARPLAKAPYHLVYEAQQGMMQYSRQSIRKGVFVPELGDNSKYLAYYETPLDWLFAKEAVEARGGDDACDH